MLPEMIQNPPDLLPSFKIINIRYIFNRLKDQRDRKHISSASNFARQPPADKTF